jgi:hypothetical protein
VLERLAGVRTRLDEALDARCGLPGDGTRSGAARSKRRYGRGRVTGQGTFELANRAHSLCLTRNHAERGKPVKIYTFGLRDGRRNPSLLHTDWFDRTFERAKNLRGMVGI